MTTTPRRRCARVALLALALTAIAGGAAAQMRVPGDYPTIQSAIDAAPSGTTIIVQPGTYREVLVIADTDKSLTIRGAGGTHATIVDAAGAGRPAITIRQATGTLVVEGLTFRNASTTDAGGGFLVDRSSPSFLHCLFEWNAAINGGGGALIASNATFAGCTFRNNTAQMVGGGVYINGGSRPVFTACEILNNTSGTAGPVGGSNGAGGGIFSLDSSPIIRGGRVSGNVAKTAGGGIFHVGSYTAGALATLVIDDAEITENEARQVDRSNASEPPATGGGVHIGDNASATISRSRVWRNTANTGGGLYALRARYELIDSIVQENVANQMPTALTTSGIGGGIAMVSSGAPAERPTASLTLTRTYVAGNQAAAGPGGIAAFGDAALGRPATVRLVDSTVHGNAGGMLIDFADAILVNSIVLRNVSSVFTPSGGGIRAVNGASLVLRQTTVSSNTARGQGGGIYIDTGARFEIDASHLYSNFAETTDGGGGIFIGSGAGSGIIRDSIVADNFGYQIADSSCARGVVEYRSNTITPVAGKSDLYVSSCGERFSAIVDLNAKANASANDSNLPRFTHYVAAPAAGTRFRLAWTIARPSLLTMTVGSRKSFASSIAGVEEVAPPYSTSATFEAKASAANGGDYSPTTVGLSVVHVPVAPPPSFRRTAGDYDGDGKADIVIYRPDSGAWYLLLSRSGFTSGAGYQWGAAGDIPVPGDYDGDGIGDIAVYRPSVAYWFILKSTTGYSRWGTYQWGATGDLPVPNDYDGDGTTDIAIFRPVKGQWFVLKSGANFTAGVGYTLGGVLGDYRPVPGDRDGDGKSDPAVFRSTLWSFLESAENYEFGNPQVNWGGVGDLLVPSDYDGDLKTDVGVYRPSSGSWYVLTSSSRYLSGLTYTWGAPDDVPVPGDYDGDGKTDVAVYRPSTAHWFLLLSSTGYTSWATYQWGATGDIPVSPLGPTIK